MRVTLCLVLFPNEAVELYDASLALIVLVCLLALIKVSSACTMGTSSQFAPHSLRLTARTCRSNRPDLLVAHFTLFGVYLDPRLIR